MPQILNILESQEYTPEECKKNPPTRSQAYAALQALACIELHEQYAQNEHSKTLTELTGASTALCLEDNLCLKHMVCAFGRHSIPVLRKVLTKEYLFSQEAIDQEVQECIEEIRSRLN